MRKERDRADRNNHQFSLLVFDVDLKDRTSSKILELGRILVRRLRSTDETGWLEGRIGVFLPDTPPEGAWKLAEDICQLIQPDSPHPKCAVYSYPMKGRPAGEDRGSLESRLAGSLKKN